MGQGFNKCIFMGNLGADPELVRMQSGQAKLKFRLAVTKKYKDRDDKIQEVTEWLNIVMWGKRAESLSKHLQKGSGVLVECEYRSFTFDKDGEKRYGHEFVCFNLNFAGGKGGGGGRSDSSDDEGGYGGGGGGYQRSGAGGGKTTSGGRGGASGGNGGSRGGGQAANDQGPPADDGGGYDGGGGFGSDDDIPF